MRALLRAESDNTMLAFEFDEVSYDKNTSTLNMFNYEGCYSIEKISIENAEFFIRSFYETGLGDLTGYTAFWNSDDIED